MDMSLYAHLEQQHVRSRYSNAMCNISKQQPLQNQTNAIYCW